MTTASEIHNELYEISQQKKSTSAHIVDYIKDICTRFNQDENADDYELKYLLNVGYEMLYEGIYYSIGVIGVNLYNVVVAYADEDELPIPLETLPFESLEQIFVQVEGEFGNKIA